MKSSKRHVFPLSEEEGVKLIRATAEKGIVLDLVFGTGGCAIVWEAGEEMPESVRLLGTMRNVLNENVEGEAESDETQNVASGLSEMAL